MRLELGPGPVPQRKRLALEDLPPGLHPLEGVGPGTNGQGASGPIGGCWCLFGMQAAAGDGEESEGCGGGRGDGWEAVEEPAAGTSGRK